MSRLKKLDIKDWDPELRAMYHADSATALELGAMRMFAHRPAIGKGLIALGSGIRQKGTLPERLMELVRLRIAFHNQCRSCMAIRYRSAVDAGVDEALVCSLEKPMEAPDLTDAERAALAEAVHEHDQRRRDDERRDPDEQRRDQQPRRAAGFALANRRGGADGGVGGAHGELGCSLLGCWLLGA